MRQLGLISPTGAMSTNQLVPHGHTQAAQQQLTNDFDKLAKIENPDIWSSYGSLMKGPKSYEEMLKLWDEMSGWDLLAAALQEFTEESCSTDSSSPGVLWYECNDANFEEELNDMLLRIGMEDRIESQSWHLSAFGNDFEKLEYAKGEGITGINFIHPYDVRRYWLAKNRQCVGYYWQGHPPDKTSIYVGLDNTTEIERVSLGDTAGVENLWFPWDIMHMRRMFSHRASEHGEPIFDAAQNIYKKLRLAVDQMVVHRAQVQPDRYAIQIDTGEQPPTDQMKTIQRWKMSMRNSTSFGYGSGQDMTSPTDLKSFYNPLALDTIFWIAKPKGFENAITKLPGTANVPDVYDIELLTDLFYSIIGMPKGWFGFGKDSGGIVSGKALLAQDIRFLRKVKAIRRPIVNGYTWLAYFHAVLTNRRPEDLEIRARMSEIGGLEEQMKLELLERQAGILDVLGSVMVTYGLPREAWIEVIFAKYMHLPQEVVNVFITSLPAEASTPALEAKRYKPTPSQSKLISEIAAKLGPHTKEVRDLQNMVTQNFGGKVSVPRRFKRVDDVCHFPKLALNDAILSTNATPWVIRDGSRTTGGTKQSLTEDRKEPGWRQFVRP